MVIYSEINEAAVSKGLCRIFKDSPHGSTGQHFGLVHIILFCPQLCNSLQKNGPFNNNAMLYFKEWDGIESYTIFSLQRLTHNIHTEN